MLWTIREVILKSVLLLVCSLAKAQGAPTWCIYKIEKQILRPFDNMRTGVLKDEMLMAK